MHFRQRYNNTLTGVLAGTVLPLVTLVLFYLATRDGLSPADYLRKVSEMGNIARIISISVFTNIIIFLVFNKFDMLRASRGVLGITILWAFVVFGIKLIPG